MIKGKEGRKGIKKKRKWERRKKEKGGMKEKMEERKENVYRRGKGKGR